MAHVCVFDERYDKGMEKRTFLAHMCNLEIIKIVTLLKEVPPCYRLYLVLHKGSVKDLEKGFNSQSGKLGEFVDIVAQSAIIRLSRQHQLEKPESPAIIDYPVNRSVS